MASSRGSRRWDWSSSSCNGFPTAPPHTDPGPNAAGTPMPASRTTRRSGLDRGPSSCALMLSTVASGAPRPRSIEEQDVSDVDSGKAILGGYPLHQLGELQGELDCKGLQRVGAAHRGNVANYRSKDGLSDLGVVIVGDHSHNHPKHSTTRIVHVGHPFSSPANHSRTTTLPGSRACPDSVAPVRRDRTPAPRLGAVTCAPGSAAIRATGPGSGRLRSTRVPRRS